MASIRKASMSLKEINDRLYKLGNQSVDKRYVRVIVDNNDNTSGHLIVGTTKSSKVRVLGFVSHYDFVAGKEDIKAYTYINLVGKRMSRTSRAVLELNFVVV